MSVSASEPVYDTIGKGYNTTRKADPFITDTIYNLLSPRPGGHYLDIGCGTGNYLAAMESRGLRMTGVDPSEIMLQQAMLKGLSAGLVRASAENLPFPANSFDGAMATLTIHHWTDLGSGLDQLHHVLKAGSHLVLFAFTPEQVQRYWLAHYFPKMIKQDTAGIPSLEKIHSLLATAGFTDLVTVPYFVREDLQDQFMYAFKHKPEKYLDENVRRGTSAFALAKDQEEIASGLALLKDDLATGKIAEVIAKFENSGGDYLFLKATKG